MKFRIMMLGMLLVVSTCFAFVDLSEKASAAIYLDDNFDPAPLPGWTATGYWHLVDDTSDPCIGVGGHPPSSHSSPNSYGYHIDASCDYDDTFQNFGELTSPSFDLSTTGIAWLHFWTWFENEGGTSYDTMWVQISPDNAAWINLEQVEENRYPMNAWNYVELDVSAWTGDATVWIRFQFDTGDDISNNFAGWYVDDVLVDDISPPIDTLTVAGTPIASGIVDPAQTLVEMELLTLTASTGSIVVTSIQVDQTGTGSDADTNLIRLYNDADGSGDLTGADVFLDMGVFTGGSVTFAPLSILVSAGTPENLLITFDIAAGATAGNTLRATILTSSYITVMAPDVVSSLNFPLDSNFVTISALITLLDNTPVADGSPVPDDYQFEVYNFDHAVVGLRPAPGENFDLNLYTDTAFTVPLESSQFVSDVVDLVALDKSVWWPAPNKGARVTGPGANYDIEMENDVMDYQITGTWTGAMSNTDVLDAFEVDIGTDGPYTMFLEVPPTADLDLFLFDFGADDAPNRGNPLASSEQTGAGVNESITFSAVAFVDYLLVVTNENLAAGAGDGTYWINPPVPPEIIATVPADLATGVPLNQNVVITFSEPIDTPTFTFTSVPDPLGWSCNWDPTDTIVTCSHNDFLASTGYTFTVTAADDMDGNPLAAGAVPNPWSWTTGTTADTDPPEIMATSPLNGGTNVMLIWPVVIMFNETINQATFTYTIAPDPGGWIWNWDPTSTIVTGTHANFAPGTLYTFTVTGADDMAGNPLGPGPIPNPWTWTTTSDVTPPNITATTPSDGATGVAVDQDVVITFSEPINTTTFGFTVSPNPGGWVWTWSAGDTVATGTHNDFATSTSYTFDVSGLTRDMAGNILAPGPVPDPWSWTTGTGEGGDTTKPSISNMKVEPNSQKQGQSVNISAKITDDSGDVTAKVKILNPEGDLVGNFSMKKGSGDTFYFVYDIPSSAAKGKYEFVIYARDDAGNTEDSSTSTFTVTEGTPTNPADKGFLAEYWWLLIIIIVVVVVLIIVALLAGRRKKRPTTATVPPPAGTQPYAPPGQSGPQSGQPAQQPPSGGQPPAPPPPP